MSGSPTSSTTASGRLVFTSDSAPGPRVGQLDLVAGERQRATEHVAQRPIVVDYEQVSCTDCVACARPRGGFLLMSYVAASYVLPGGAAISRRTAPRIPLTNAGASAPQNRLAVSTASSIAPSGGIA